MLSNEVVRPVWSRERPEGALAREGVLLHGGLVLELRADREGRLTLRADDARTGRELWQTEVGRAAMATPVLDWPTEPRASLQVLDARRVVVAAIAESEIAVHRVSLDGKVQRVDRFEYGGSVFGPHVSCDGAGWCAVEHYDRDDKTQLVELRSDTQELWMEGKVVGHGEGVFVLRYPDNVLVGLHADEQYGLDDVRGGPEIVNDSLYEVDDFDYNEWAEEAPSRESAPATYYNVFDAKAGGKRWQKQLGRWHARPFPGAVVFSHEGIFDVHDPRLGHRIDQVKLARNAEPVGYDLDRVLWCDANHELGLGTSWSIPVPGVGACTLAIEHDLLLVVHEHSLHVFA